MTNLQLVNVSDLNQYLYCPRRLWYLKFQATQGRNYQRVDGILKHNQGSNRGGWISELYLESEQLGLKGKIDVLDLEGENPVPVERKRSQSGTIYWNDEIQVAAYGLLLEERLDSQIREGVVYLWETDERIRIEIKASHREAVMDYVWEIQHMNPNEIPPLVDNANKCEKCSTREYCMPKETAILEPQKAEGTGWENRV